jgi:hypothetical protein
MALTANIVQKNADKKAEPKKEHMWGVLNVILPLDSILANKTNFALTNARVNGLKKIWEKKELNERLTCEKVGVKNLGKKVWKPERKMVIL